MSVALYIVPEREIAGFDCFVNGKALGHMSERAMGRFAQAAGVADLMEFCSVCAADLEEFLDEDEDGVFEADLPEETWFDAGTGLESVRAMMALLRAKPETVADGAAVLEDLEEFEQVLLRLEKERVRFHLAVDF